MTSTRSSGLPHLAGLSGTTNFRLNRMDLPCSRRSLWLHAGGTNPGSTASHSQCCATCDSAFPIAGQGRLLRSRSISGLFSRSLHSGLQPPCLRFAAAVTGRHARLGSRLLARLLPRPSSQTADFNALARRNPHRSQRALLTHRALALDGDEEPLLRPRVQDARIRQMALGNPFHPVPRQSSSTLAAAQ